MTQHPYRAQCHRDGSVTYWSVYEQVWRRACTCADISDAEWAARGIEERERLERHFSRALWAQVRADGQASTPWA